uniref:Protein VAC14 homolog n=1 Tax=Strigamia maritima TaxID=126957 RepID=T1IMF9_STRMM
MTLITPEGDDENSEVGDEEKTTAGGDENSKKLDLAPVVDVLTRQLLHTSMQTKLGVLRWIYLFHRKTPNKIFAHVEEIFPVLLKTLSDPSDEVVILNLEVLAEISLSVAGKTRQCKMDMILPDSVKELQDSLKRLNSYFINLLQLFGTDQQLLEDRGSFIVRQLCLLLSAEDIYQTLAEILLHETDLKFASIMVQTLNTILLTSSELFDLRSDLNTLATELICLNLCFSGELEVTVDFLTEIDKLLLDCENNYYLVKSLYGLLMLLPQSEAFRMLHYRLDCIPRGHLVPNAGKTRPHKLDKFQTVTRTFPYCPVAQKANKKNCKGRGLGAKSYRPNCILCAVSGVVESALMSLGEYKNPTQEDVKLAIENQVLDESKLPKIKKILDDCMIEYPGPIFDFIIHCAFEKVAEVCKTLSRAQSTKENGPLRQQDRKINVASLSTALNKQNSLNVQFEILKFRFLSDTILRLESKCKAQSIIPYSLGNYGMPNIRTTFAQHSHNICTTFAHNIRTQHSHTTFAHNIRTQHSHTTFGQHSVGKHVNGTLDLRNAVMNSAYRPTNYRQTIQRLSELTDFTADHASVVRSSNDTTWEMTHGQLGCSHSF